MPTCNYCERGIGGRDRLLGDMEVVRVMDEGYRTHDTSSLVAMLVACSVAAVNDTLSVDMSKKLHELREELDRRVPWKCQNPDCGALNIAYYICPKCG